MSQKILIIDDDEQLTELIEEFLSSFNYDVVSKHIPEKGIEYLNKNDVDLVVLDVMMPEMDGFQVLRKIRETSAIPVVMLTAKGDVSDRIVGLELGADDYMPKPFEPRELLARIQSILRRSQAPESMLDILEFNEGLVIDKLRQEVTFKGEIVQLSTTEIEALVLLAEHAGEVLDRDFLVESIRGIHWQAFDRSVDVLISRMRTKLSKVTKSEELIKTIHGIGYKFVGTYKN